jgi:DNA-directed RNA polymerase
MTKVYNVSILGIKDQLISEFKKVNLGEKTIRYEAPGINGARVLLNNSEVLKIASIINSTIFNEFPSLKIIYDYFLSIVRLMVKLGIPLIWFTPSGLQITQSYSKSEIYKVSINIRGRSRKMVLKDWIDKIDGNKQINAVIPNIIHSLDASHLINLINSAINNNFTPILTIHDCFGTHPNRMEYLAHEVKKEFILLYSNPNFLEMFHNRLIQSIKDNNFIIEKDTSSRVNTLGESGNIVILGNKKLKIPIYPKIGKLEINNIINSKYMIM